MTINKLTLNLKPSFGLGCYIVLVHAFTFFILSYYEKSILWLLLGFIILFFSFYYCMKKYAFLSMSSSIISILYQRDDQCQLMFFDDSHIKVKALKQVFISPFLLILYFVGVDNKKRYVAVIARDMIDLKTFRHLICFSNFK